MFVNTKSKIDVALEVLRILNPPVVMPAENNFGAEEDDDNPVTGLKNKAANYIADWITGYKEEQPAPPQQKQNQDINSLINALLNPSWNNK
jgi:hypothetical protein